ncbi:MAG: hypothetical protein A2X61_05975 [Ignavibacteria bacterium GWB2_35_12]|nr:MAG: hypothetical protein A2X63_02460 [Ignavibacteria bacterium GWA2_35_8]OGU42297.1 MAG: hypothetical protein A2X61_05975 [Ignavibacteria bacterium GWB2_35_12]OGU86407.1 MAG: hypothetical protein A2220_03970 [Ignavibacteria bacterium RIFOXYA2_FULL_35_10]OGV22127.1 MAG: hypothetical protein A2475_05445 [Ignavibacteria bacterium RIFOXYC2_FULL_35_21]
MPCHKNSTISQKEGFSQKELAYKSGITQQQLSKIEKGENCNIYTFLKVCNALGLMFDLTQIFQLTKILMKCNRKIQLQTYGKQ